jgi:hypothetical protein
MRKFILIVTLAFLPIFVGAAGHQGVISQVHINSNVANRGLCVQMEPAIPTSTGWGCIWSDSNARHTEITSMLLTGYAASKQCAISWGETDSSGHVKIYGGSCFK